MKNDLPRAIREYEAALALAPDDAKLYEEIDRLYEAAGTPAAKRLALLEKNHKTVAQRDDALAREIRLLVQTGKYDKALGYLEGRRFHVWEGGGDIHGVFVEAHLLRGEKALDGRKPAEALKDFEAALTYPENLEVAAPAGGGGSARAFYLIGPAREELSDAAGAKQAFEKAASMRGGFSESAYYSGLATAKLGREPEARAALRSPAAGGRRAPQSGPGHGLTSRSSARSSRPRPRRPNPAISWGWPSWAWAIEPVRRPDFRAALAANPNHAGAARWLTRMEKS